MVSFILAIIFGFFACWIFEIIMIRDKALRERFWEHHIPIFGFHLHHSVYGALLICLSTVFLFTKPSITLIFAGIGWGIILRHTKTDRKMVYIEKITFWSKIKEKLKWIK